ncbi:GIY-YIG nuclease family protein [Aureliella helgolandensis]|uniref:GIY-YIG domain-containing protein n=1 Tax=Aureliella helgolandensis TaxID=2527968 RepID=A0A518GCM9_9BACT|nr:hypothetical protein [Aureliella helgolandensis]QDV26355.1 hypothetical protein Q31a_47280 [Aureliella helgolandensis]
MFAIPEGLEPMRYMMNWQDARYWCHFVANRPYVYAICYPTGLPFYVGKGRAERLIQHGHFLREELVRGGVPRDEKERVIKGLHVANHEEMHVILALCDRDAEAYRLEAMIIATWGRRANGGMLTNADEGVLTQVPESWVIPEPPAIAVNNPNCNGGMWVKHPKINPRAPTHRGVIISCPVCREECMHRGGQATEDVRCPYCHHFFSVDGERLLQHWYANRPKLGQVTKFEEPDVEYSCIAAEPVPAETRAPEVHSERSLRHIKRFWRR